MFESSRNPPVSEPIFNDLQPASSPISAYNDIRPHPQSILGSPRHYYPSADAIPRDSVRRVDHMHVSSPRFEQSPVPMNYVEPTLVNFILGKGQSSALRSRPGSMSISRRNLPPYFVSSFPGTSQYAVGGSSACGLASLCAVKKVLMLGQSSGAEFSSTVNFAETIDNIRFHEVRWRVA